MTISKTAKAIENLIRKIQDNPLMISRERDLQVFLSKELIDHFPIYHKTRKKNIHDKFYKTQRVHLEYPSHNHNYDIIVFDAEDIQNINSPQGLSVSYQNSKGEEGKDASKFKRSVLCTALLELKKPEGEAITYEKIKDDFNFLRSWSNEYEFFNNNPELFFICYQFWKTKAAPAKTQIETYRDAYILANKEPLINFYLIIGPYDFWNNYLEEHPILQNNIDTRIYFV